MHYECFGISIQIAAGRSGSLLCTNSLMMMMKGRHPKARHCALPWGYLRVMPPQGMAQSSSALPKMPPNSRRASAAELPPCPRGEHGPEVIPEKHRSQHGSAGFYLKDQPPVPVLLYLCNRLKTMLLWYNNSKVKSSLGLVAPS